MLEETFIVDAVSHAHNFRKDNYRNERYAEAITEMIYSAVTDLLPSQLQIPREKFVRDWSVEETAKMLFLESNTDIATLHPTPIYAFHDGLTSTEKARKTVEKWPDRFRAFATVDPLKGQDAFDSLEKQVERYDPVGLKLYPSSWDEESHKKWVMDDESVAFPIFEHAKDLGLDVIAVHKSIPYGPVPTESYRPDDVDGAAASFPDIDFMIVHGGLAFTEEVAWQLARFPNVYVNMETLGVFGITSPRRFTETLATLIDIGGADVMDRLCWGSGAMVFHPQLQLEAFRDFKFPEEYLSDISQITKEDKQKILGENYARLIGLDIEEAKTSVQNDTFDQQFQEKGVADPYTMTEVRELGGN